MGQHMASVCYVEFFGNWVDEVCARMWCAREKGVVTISGSFASKRRDVGT